MQEFKGERQQSEAASAGPGSDIRILFSEFF
jgi:hypothetical protein